MTGGDGITERRLARLRQHDSIGMYAGDGPASGLDDTGAVSVTIDATNRVTGVTVNPLAEPLRDPTALATAVSRAHLAAITSKLPDRTSSPAARRPRRARAPQPAAWVPLDNILESGRPFDGDAHLHAPPGLAEPLERHVGHSRNECVTVVLDLGSPTGTPEIDGGWLRQAAHVNVSTALTQAFLDAYRERDSR